MFEKDSIVDEFTISVGGEFHLTEEMPFEDIIFEAVKFGYNKANEWHYPSKGEYPKDDINVLVAYYTRFNVDTKQPSGELECKVAGFLGKKWYNIDTGCGDIDDWLNKPNMVYAWKEIKLPKEVLK